MSFKIKDGVRVGTVDVFNSAGALLVNAPTATSAAGLTTGRTISATGDAAWSVTFDGTSAQSAALTLATVNSNVGTFNNFTVNAKGLITAASNVSYLTAEADTLSTVTVRGATTATAITITNATASTTTATGALIITGGVGIGGAVYAGSLQNTPIGSTTRSTGAFTTLAANGATTLTAGTSSTTTGTGTLVVTGGVGISENLNVGGNIVITGNLTINGSTTTTNSTVTTIVDPIISLGGITGGGAPTSDDAKDRGINFQWHNGTVAKQGFFGFDRATGYFTYIPDATISSEVVSGTLGDLQATNFRGALIGNADTATKTATARSISTTGDATWTVNFDGSANVTAAITLATVNSNVGSGYNTFTVNAKGLITAASTTAYLTAEADTLATVTGRGATTGSALTFTNTTDSSSWTTGALVVSGGVAVQKSLTISGDIANTTAAGVIVSRYNALQATVATVATTPVDTFAVATYRSTIYTVQITQGTSYQVSNIMVVHNGTTTTMTEYAVLETGGVLGTFTSDISSGSARLLVTMGSATLATINMDKVVIVI